MNKELTQLHEMTTFIPMDYDILTKEQRAPDIAYLIILKNKISGEINERACANSRKKRTYINK